MLLLVGCGSRSPDHPDAANPDAPVPAFTVGGTVSGLVSDGLVLANNGGDALAVASDGPFVFATPVPDAAPFAVTVLTQPSGELCDVAGATGMIASANVDSVAVTCHGTTVSLAIDGSTACSVRIDGTLWCWGEFVHGSMALTPVRIGADSDWASVAGPYCALKTDQSAWCWSEDFIPMRIDANTWVDLATWSEGICGIRTDGTLWCQTPSGWTQQGVGDTWTHVSTTNFGTCAIRTDGTLWCEGDNSAGELGVGDTVPHTGLVQVPGTWKDVVVGWNKFACAIRSDDTLWCWGDNGQHRVDDTAKTPVTSPEQRATGTFTHVTLTESLDTACALAPDGTAWCWGENAYGQLGVGDMDLHTDPVEVAGGHRWNDVQAGNGATCGLARDATVWCWGMSFFGIFGDGNGSQHSRNVPGIVP